MHFHVKLPYTWSLHRAIVASYSHVPPATMYLSGTDIWYQGPLDCITILCAHIDSYNSRKSFKVMLRKCINQKVMWIYIHHEMITFSFINSVQFCTLNLMHLDSVGWSIYVAFRTADSIKPPVSQLRVTGALACQPGFESYIHQANCLSVIAMYVRFHVPVHIFQKN